MNKILIIDDDRELCALIKRSVQSEHIEADFCNTGKEGLQKLKEQEYQLVVLDVMMPGMDGFETLEEIRKENSLPILMFTSKNDSISKVRGLRAGADDYLTKPFSTTELMARIRVALRHLKKTGTESGQAVRTVGGLSIDLEKRLVYLDGAEIHVTPLEYNLLTLFFKNAGKVLTSQYIIKEIYGISYGTDTQALRALMAGLRRKIEKSPAKPRYILTEIGVGYRLVNE